MPHGESDAESSAVLAWLFGEPAGEARAAALRARLNRAAAHWTLWRVAPEVVERARQPFPGEPIRTLDAFHLASAMIARAAVVGLALLSLDSRIRAAAAQLGLSVLPA